MSASLSLYFTPLDGVYERLRKRHSGTDDVEANEKRRVDIHSLQKSWDDNATDFPDSSSY